MTGADVPAEHGAKNRLTAWAHDLPFYRIDLVFLLVVLLSTGVIIRELFGGGGVGAEARQHIILGRYVQPIGWGATLLAVGATLYYSSKRSVLLGLRVAEAGFKALVAGELRRALDQHIVVSLAAVGLAVLHILNFAGTIQLTTGWLALGLMLVVAASGAFGRFVAAAPPLRRRWRQFHLPYTALFFIVLTVHILVKIGLVGAAGD